MINPESNSVTIFLTKMGSTSRGELSPIGQGIKYNGAEIDSGFIIFYLGVNFITCFIK